MCLEAVLLLTSSLPAAGWWLASFCVIGEVGFDLSEDSGLRYYLNYTTNSVLFVCVGFSFLESS